MGDYNRDDDKLSPEEFKKLETNENKMTIGSRIKSLLSSNTPESGAAAAVVHEDSGEQKLNALTMRIEKQDGRFEAMMEHQNSMNEKILDFSSQIGELRSIFISKEKFFEKIEQKFAEFNEVIAHTNLAKIGEELGNKDEKIAQLDVKISILTEKTERLSGDILVYKQTMEKIQNFESILNTLQEIRNLSTKAEKMQAYMERLVEKSENSFEEARESTDLLKKVDARLSDLDKTVDTSAKRIDKLDSTIKGKAAKTEVDTIFNDVRIIKKDLFKHNIKKLFRMIKEDEDADVVAKSPERLSSKPTDVLQEKPAAEEPDLKRRFEARLSNIASSESLQANFTPIETPDPGVDLQMRSELPDAAPAQAQHPAESPDVLPFASSVVDEKLSMGQLSISPIDIVNQPVAEALPFEDAAPMPEPVVEALPLEEPVTMPQQVVESSSKEGSVSQAQPVIEIQPLDEAATAYEPDAEIQLLKEHVDRLAAVDNANAQSNEKPVEAMQEDKEEASPKKEKPSEEILELRKMLGE